MNIGEDLDQERENRFSFQNFIKWVVIIFTFSVYFYIFLKVVFLG